MSKWITEPKRRYDYDKRTYGAVIPHEDKHQRPTSNGGCVIPNGVEIDTGFLHNASGPESFGGLSEWPYVRSEITIPVGRYDIQAELVEELKSCIDRVLSKYKVPSEE